MASIKHRFLIALFFISSCRTGTSQDNAELTLNPFGCFITSWQSDPDYRVLMYDSQKRALGETSYQLDWCYWEKTRVGATQWNALWSQVEAGWYKRKISIFVHGFNNSLEDAAMAKDGFIDSAKEVDQLIAAKKQERSKAARQLANITNILADAPKQCDQ